MTTEADSINASKLLNQINGKEIEDQLIAVASIGGKQLNPNLELPIRYSVNRLALSENDRLAREDLIRPWMKQAGLKTLDFPLGLVGIKEGTDPSLDPVVILSHTDSVPEGDMYDGVLGVIGGIEAIRAINASGIPHRRTIMVLALTGEESAAFNFALFGSKGIFEGLTEKELDAQKPGQRSLRNTLGSNANKVKIRVFGNELPNPHAVLELHVEQDDKLTTSNIDLGIVTKIAAPTRHQIIIGNTEIPLDATDYRFAKHAKLTVKGNPAHSGATPMGREYRADGLVATSEFLWNFLQSNKIDIGDIGINSSTINKIPGITQTMLRIRGESPADTKELFDKLKLKAQNTNQYPTSSKFEPEHVLLEEISANGSRFFHPELMRQRQQAALSAVRVIENISTYYFNLQKDRKVVGTVGTYDTLPDGRISLGFDLRGNEKISRNQAFDDIFRTLQEWQGVGINFGEQLPGSGNPVSTDQSLVELTQEVANGLNISTMKIISGAGHDIQSAIRAGHRGMLIFCQSEKGIAHNPSAYTKPDNLEKGVKALTAIAIKLAL